MTRHTADLTIKSFVYDIVRLDDSNPTVREVVKTGIADGRGASLECTARLIAALQAGDDDSYFVTVEREVSRKVTYGANDETDTTPEAAERRAYGATSVIEAGVNVDFIIKLSPVPGAPLMFVRKRPDATGSIYTHSISFARYWRTRRAAESWLAQRPEMIAAGATVDYI